MIVLRGRCFFFNESSRAKPTDEDKGGQKRQTGKEREEWRKKIKRMGRVRDGDVYK
jgi:hypothetical protein